MIFESKNYSIGTFLFFFIAFITMSSKGALSLSVKPDEIATVVGKAFTYKLPIELTVQNDYNYKVNTTFILYTLYSVLYIYIFDLNQNIHTYSMRFLLFTFKQI